jgi:hypothetical protein
MTERSTPFATWLGHQRGDPIARALLELGLPPDDLEHLDDPRHTQVELWARGVVVDQDALARFFAAWQTWEQQEVKAGHIPDVFNRKTYTGTELLAHFEAWTAQRGGCRVDAARQEWFQALLSPEQWSWLIHAEPRLRDLQQLVYAISDPGDTPVFCANATWYGGSTTRPPIKAYLSRLVGDEAIRHELDPAGHDRILCTSTAFDAAQDTLYELLPSCRGACSCL